ncbi:hypothetical protein AB2N08_11995 [Massilia aurea]|uniref:hypothetical protein n=1 Tax=Massilia aurea TaxID=373040 RepID=UPI0034632CD1
MLSTATKRAVLSFLFTIANGAALAGDHPPRYVIEPALGLRLDAGIKLESLPDEVSSLCSRDNENWIHYERVFARAHDAATTYYVVSGYSKRRNPEAGQSLYEPIVRGGLYAITGNSCMDDPADESFLARDVNQTPLPILQKLARDLAARLVQAVGGPDQLRAEIRNQRIDFDRLSPELQDAFKPYFVPKK